MREAVIVDLVRTPVGKGKPGGALSGWHPVDLLGEVLSQLVTRSGIDPEQLDDVFAGVVTQAGQQSLNVARSAILAAGLPESLPGTTIDRQCGSSQQAIHFAVQAVLSGTDDAVLACGVESMSRVPMLAAVLDQDPWGDRIARRYPGGLVNQGIAAELIAAKWKLSRSEVDDFSARSHSKAAAALDVVTSEFCAIVSNNGDGAAEKLLDADEGIRPNSTPESLSKLAPAFWNTRDADNYPDINWVVTAGGASQISDGAAAVLVMERAKAEALGLKARARVIAVAVAGDDPILMLTGVIPATKKVLARSGLTIDDIDLFEVNEAFAPVVLAWQREFGVADDKLNVRGGAIANGHPLGASGAKLATTLVNSLEAGGKRYGLQTMCEGGGMANAMIIERLDR